jgi:hypothetical protein
MVRDRCTSAAGFYYIDIWGNEGIWILHEGKEGGRDEILLDDGQGVGAVFLDFFPAGAEFTEGVGGEDIDLFFAEVGFAAFYFFFELAAFDEEAFEDLFFGDVGGAFALDVDDSAAVAGEDGDVGAFAFTGAVHDAAHDGNFDGEFDFFGELLADILHELEEIDLDAAASGAGDEFRADAGAEAEDVEKFQTIFDFVDGVVGVADADGVADAGAEEMAQGDDGADGAGFLGAGVSHAKVQGVVEAFADFFVGVDHKRGLNAFGTDDDVVEVLFFEDFEIFFELGDHDGQEVAVLVVREDTAQFLHAFLLVFAFDDGAFIDADADGDFFGFAGLDDVDDLGAVVDVAGVKADLVNAGFDGFEGALEMEMDVGDDGDGDAGEDFLESLSVLFLGDGDADNVSAGGGEFMDFGDAFIDVPRVAGRHGLDGDGSVAPDAYKAVCFVANDHFSRFPSGNHV